MKYSCFPSRRNVLNGVQREERVNFTERGFILQMCGKHTAFLKALSDGLLLWTAYFTSMSYFISILKLSSVLWNVPVKQIVLLHV